jgi:hypothetical protein
VKEDDSKFDDLAPKASAWMIRHGVGEVERVFKESQQTLHEIHR